MGCASGFVIEASAKPSVSLKLQSHAVFEVYTRFSARELGQWLIFAISPFHSAGNSVVVNWVYPDTDILTESVEMALCVKTILYNEKDPREK